MKRLSVLLLSILLFAGCREEPFHDFDTGPIPAGAFRYTGLLSSQDVVVRGWMQIDTANNTRISGSWHLERKGGSSNIGPQIGDGLLAGTLDRGLAIVNLNPDHPDDYVELNGVLTANDFSGQWSYHRGATIIARGQFQARKDPQ